MGRKAATCLCRYVVFFPHMQDGRFQLTPTPQVPEHEPDSRRPGKTQFSISEMSDRKHRTHLNLDKLLSAMKGQRHQLRDGVLTLLMHCHGLSGSEACALRLEQLDLEIVQLRARRLKNGVSTTHSLRRNDITAIKQWHPKRPKLDDPRLFLRNRRRPLHRGTVGYMVRRRGDLAGVRIPIQPHMRRHACGSGLAEQGADTLLIRDYLGHRNIQNTTICTARNPARFERLWR